MKSVHSDAYQAVIRALKQARQRTGLTQQQLAKRLGRPQSFVTKYGSGERLEDRTGEGYCCPWRVWLSVIARLTLSRHQNHARNQWITLHPPAQNRSRHE
jgi:hypothetical protein